jgi:ribosomal protein S25
VDGVGCAGRHGSFTVLIAVPRIPKGSRGQPNAPTSEQILKYAHVHMDNMGLFEVLRRRRKGMSGPHVSKAVGPESTIPRGESIEAREGLVETPRDSTQSRRDSTRLAEVSNPSESKQVRLQLRNREQFALGVGYGAFQSTLNDIRDKIVEIQKVLDQDVAKERSIEEVSKKLEALSRAYEEHKSAVPSELADETRRRIEEARLSAKLMEVYTIVQNSHMITPAELATRMNLRSNTCSQYLNELVARGLIRKITYGRFGVCVDASASSRNTPDQPKDGV